MRKSQLSKPSDVHIVLVCAVAAIAILLWFMTPGQAWGDTGYAPAQYAGKCNPWPNDVPLPNEQLRACYNARYGQDPGAGGLRAGYCCELLTANYIALENACRAGEFGPGHNCVATTVEVTDSSFANARGGPFMLQWWWRTLDGGSPERAVHVSINEQACGPFTKSSTSGYPQYFVNDPPCGGAPPPPPPPPPVNVCTAPCILPESCQTCPLCPVCPRLLVIPRSVRDACVEARKRFPPGTGNYRKIVKPLCTDFINKSTHYEPGIPSNAQNVTTLYQDLYGGSN